MSRPTDRELNEQLKDLVSWEKFALNLPSIGLPTLTLIKRKNRDIQDQKQELFNRWLRACPEASWDDVVEALKKSDENSLALSTQEYVVN